LELLTGFDPAEIARVRFALARALEDLGESTEATAQAQWAISDYEASERPEGATEVQQWRAMPHQLKVAAHK
jgi:hypothetical protein